MRIVTIAGTIAVLVMPAASYAQGKPQTDVKTTQQTTGSVNIGARGTDSSGDIARYERYRDLGDGLFVDLFRVERERSAWQMSLWGNNLGRRDQRIAGAIERPGTLKVWGQWDQIPMLMSNSTRTLFTENIGDAPNVLTIPDTVQTQIQTAAASARSGIFAANAIAFDTQSKRHTGSGGFEYLATPELTIRTDISSTRRTGIIPFGGSFGHSSLVEMPAPIDHRLTNMDTSAEFARGDVVLRAGLTGSWFRNEDATVTFDNPFRATDIAGTPSRGALSLPPGNSYITGNAMATVKLPSHSRATAYFSVGRVKDAGVPIMAQTVNTANLAAIVPLPRATVDGKGRTSAVNLNFNSRPTKLFDFTAKYQMFDYDNQTPEFVLPQRVAYDATPSVATFSTLGGQTSPLIVETEPFGVKRHSFDMEARVKPAGAGTAGVGYTHLVEDRSLRFFEKTTENGVRLVYDLTTFRNVSFRAKYEHAAKRGDVTDEAERELFNIGEQPATRHYDIASRDRDRVTVLGSYMPTGMLALTASVAAGRDDYLESRFGLRDNKHRVYSAGADYVPTDRVTFNTSYSYERYDSVQNSRTASPPTGASVLTFEQFQAAFLTVAPPQQIADARYDWGATGADRVHSIVAGVQFSQIGKKLDLRLDYDYNRARALYQYVVGANIPLRTLPEDIDPAQTALPPPTQLPLVRSELRRGTLDAVYSLTKRVGVGFTIWHEGYSVTDYTLDIDANPDLIRGSSVLLGYMYRPYTATTYWGRLILHW